MRFVVNPFTDLLDAIASAGSGGAVVGSLTGNDGIVVPPDSSGNIDVLGNNSQGINITGNSGANTLTVAGINASTSQIGVLATATNGQASAQSSTSVALTPSNITSLFSSNPLPASQGGTGIASPTLHSLIVGGGATSYTQLGVASDGQIPIGSGGADPVLATITAGTGITVTNGAGSITIASSAGGFTWNSVTSASNPITLVPENGYICNGASSVHFILPATAAVGDTYKIIGTANLWTIAQNALQSIGIGALTSTAGIGGSVTASTSTDCVELVCTVANTNWRSQSVQGNLTIV